MQSENQIVHSLRAFHEVNNKTPAEHIALKTINTDERNINFELPVEWNGYQGENGRCNCNIPHEII